MPNIKKPHELWETLRFFEREFLGLESVFKRVKRRKIFIMEAIQTKIAKWHLEGACLALVLLMAGCGTSQSTTKNEAGNGKQKHSPKTANDDTATEIRVVEDNEPIKEDTTIDIPSPSETSENKQNDEPLFLAVEKDPEFPGGRDSLRTFIRNTLEYPPKAKKAGIEGTVVLRFVVNSDGSISNIQTHRGVNKALNQEAKRIVKSMPKWKPGRQRGKKVRCAVSLPIPFSLDEEK